MLHAGVADRSMWHEHRDWLAAAGYRAIAPELPGCGEAEPTRAPWEDVLATQRELDIDRATLVGNSFGAAVALRMAVVAPTAAAGLVLISPPPVGGDPSPQLSAAWQAEEQALAAGDEVGAVDAVVTAWTQPDAPDALRERVAAMQRRTFQMQADFDEAPEAPDPVEQNPSALEHVGVPALLAAGEHDLPDFKRAAQELADALPLGRLVSIPGAGHLAPLETPDEFRGLLQEFLRADGVSGS